uniref:Uncharacterized protein n=1 Tax=Arundo donax TaxID=35708 RepID=A0A0A8YT57_ARUDO
MLHKSRRYIGTINLAVKTTIIVIASMSDTSGRRALQPTHRF